jgi:hypothetical protein
MNGVLALRGTLLWRVCAPACDQAKFVVPVSRSVKSVPLLDEGLEPRHSTAGQASQAPAIELYLFTENP